MAARIRKLSRDYRLWAVEGSTAGEVLKAAAKKANRLEAKGFFVESVEMNHDFESGSHNVSVILTVLEI